MSEFTMKEQDFLQSYHDQSFHIFRDIERYADILSRSKLEEKN